MGFNTTMIVRNDCLADIERDMGFGAKVAAAIREHGNNTSEQVDIVSRFSANAATIIETHHADLTAVVAVGGNFATVLANSLAGHSTLDEQRRLLEDALEQVKAQIAAAPKL